MSERVIIGSRKSALALWQTEHVAGLLRAAHPALTVEIRTFSTRGDEVLDTALPAIGGKGLFTEALETALREGVIDYAVHSLKDLPTDPAHGLTLAAITARANPRDVLVSSGGLGLDALPHGAMIGTSSHRRAAQLRAYRPDLRTLDIRGNVGTRIEKALAPNSPYDAIVLAHAGLARLDALHYVSQVLPLTLMLPAAGQAALAVQSRDELHSIARVHALHHPETAHAVAAERAFLAALGGGCSVPVAAYAEVIDGLLHLRGRVVALDGSPVIDVNGTATLQESDTLGAALAQEALSRGAKLLIDGGTA